MSRLKVLKPEIFQGNLQKKKYFEGWYFKHVSEDLNRVYALIPGISLTKEDKHAFIQVINGMNGETHYISYPLNKFSWNKNKLEINIGNSFFSEGGINIDIEEEGLRMKGKLEYSGNIPYPGSFLAPGIMGWYSFVPFMECYHGVVSVNHFLKGSLNVNGIEENFTNGKGYIEKDWGRSFPECWIWLQSNSFSDPSSSLFFSVAKIPWLGKYFMGFIAFLYLNGEFYMFSSYNKSQLSELNQIGNEVNIKLQSKENELIIKAKVNQSGELIAPRRGSMNRRIKESIDSSVSYSLLDKDSRLIHEARSDRAGLEIIDGIFQLIQ